MATVDLTRLTKNEVSMLTGHARGLHARDLFHLDELETSADSIEVLAPHSLDTITPSFVQGLFARSVSVLGDDGLRKKYDLSRLPSSLRDDILTGIARLAIHSKRMSLTH
jgi:hypothetical protein